MEEVLYNKKFDNTGPKGEKDFYYNPYRVLSHTDADISLSVGGRGIGKTYGYKYDCIKRFIEKGEEWFYIRRWPKELEGIDLLFDDVKPLFPGYEFRIGSKGRMYTRVKKTKNWLRMGYTVALSKLKAVKGVPYTEVGTILMDEFLIDEDDKRTSFYIKGEVKKLFELYETVARCRNVRLILLSNARSVVNPYFVHLGIKPKDCTPGIHKINCVDAVVVLEICESENYMDNKKKTRSGRLMSTCDLYETSINNKFVDDNYQYVAKKPNKATHCINIRYGGKTYGIYQYDTALYCTLKPNGKCVRNYCCNLDDSAEGYLIVRGYREANDLKTIRALINRGLVYYDTVEIKYAMLEFFRKVNIL